MTTVIPFLQSSAMTICEAIASLPVGTWMLWSLTIGFALSWLVSDFRSFWKKSRRGVVNGLLELMVVLWKIKQETIDRVHAWYLVSRAVPTFCAKYQICREDWWQVCSYSADFLRRHSWSSRALMHEISAPMVVEQDGLALLHRGSVDAIREYYRRVFPFQYIYFNVFHTVNLFLRRPADQQKAVETLETMLLEYGCVIVCPHVVRDIDKQVVGGMSYARYFTLGKLPVSLEAYGVRYKVRSTGEIVDRFSLLYYLQEHPVRYLLERNRGQNLGMAIRLFYYFEYMQSFEDIELQLDWSWWGRDNDQLMMLPLTSTSSSAAAAETGHSTSLADETKDDRWVSVNVFDAIARFDMGMPCLAVVYRLSK